jgi:hypothetical protein
MGRRDGADRRCVVNPWSRLEALAFVLWILFFVQATVGCGAAAIASRGARPRSSAAASCFLGLIGASLAQLRHEGIIDFPYLRAWVVFAGLLASATSSARTCSAPRNSRARCT